VPRSELALGQSLLVVNGLNTVLPTTLTSVFKAPAISNSDTLTASLDVAGSENIKFGNSFVFNLSGDFVAIVSAQKKIVPAFYFNSAWQSLFKQEPVLRASFGVNYLDLSAVKTSAVNLSKGAWLYPSGSEPAVAKNSPAQLAGLQSGDVITWINNTELDANNDLADIIANYLPGDKIIVTYLRGSVEKEVEVVLGTAK
jgi:S1-C subfamily serine protease